MEEIEVPTEHLSEQINEKAEELYEKKERWTLHVAISTALMAVLAAIAGLLAGHHSNEALIDQIKASDQWAYYQAKSIKAEIRSIQPTSIASTKTSPEKTKQEEEKIKSQAEEHTKTSEMHLQKHILLARAVTLLQISIAISAIAILTRKRFLWVAGIAVALGGSAFLVLGII